jgi:hypothetical protein
MRGDLPALDGLSQVITLGWPDAAREAEARPAIDIDKSLHSGQFSSISTAAGFPLVQREA